MSSPRGWLAVAAGLAVGVSLLAADGPSKPPAGKVPSPDPTGGERSPAETRSAPGNSITLSQKEYQNLQEELSRLRAQVRDDKLDSPSRCKVAGTVVGETVHLVLEYEFRTHQPRGRVALGCTQGFPSKAELDGGPPFLRWGPEGLRVEAESAGNHKLVLEMDLPLISRDKAGEQGFDLDLPAAPMTLIDPLKVPVWVKKVRSQLTVRGGAAGRQVAREEFRTDPPNPGETAQVNLLKTPGLGPVERLELTWEGQPPMPGATPLPALEKSQVVLRIGERTIATRVELTLGTRRGETTSWQLLVPPQANLRVPENDSRLPVVEPPRPGEPLRTIRLKKPTGDPLTVIIEMEQLRQGKAVPVGPFIVVGALPQQGDILICAPADVALSYQRLPEAPFVLTERELTEEEKHQYPRALALRYGIPSVSEKGTALPFLNLDTNRVLGVVEARVSHTLRLVDTDPGQPPAWRLATTLEVKAFHAEMEHLRLRMPPDFEFDRKFGLAPAGEVQGPEWVDPGTRIAQLTLTPRKKGPFKVTLEGRFQAVARAAGQSVLELPTPLGTLDRGCQVTVTVPDDLELVPSRPGTLWDSSKPEGFHKRTWILDRQPERLEIAWKPFRPDLTLEERILLRLEGRQARVQHELWLPPGQVFPGPLSLKVPESVRNLAAVGEGPNLPQLVAREGGRLLAPLATPPDRDHPLILKYAFLLEEAKTGSRTFPVPLVIPEQATQGETRVLVWTDPGTQPELDDQNWEQRPEEVKGEERFPSLMVLSRKPTPALVLRLPEISGISLPAFRVLRTLIQVTVDEQGQQTYRARYLLNQIGARSVEVELPAPLFQTHLPEVTVFYRGKEAAWQPVDEAGAVTSLSNIGRIVLEPGERGKPAELEIAFVLTPGRISGSHALVSTLQPPFLHGDLGLAPVRWQVVLPPTWLPLFHRESFPSGFKWGLRGWLLAPQPALDGADLERWFLGPEEAPQEKTETAANPTVVCWCAGSARLRLVHVPQEAWLFLCSLLVLLAGGGLIFLTLPRVLIWGMGIVLLGGGLAAGFFWPGLLASIFYGCQPGLLVLLPLLVLHEVFQQRYRRKVENLPSFRREPRRSSFSRPSGSKHSQKEPSTVDIPPPSPELISEKPGTDGQ